MKKKFLKLLSVFALGFMANILPTNAQSRLDFQNLELNNEQSKIASEIEQVMEKENYPSYYGGAYISDDSSHVVLQIVKDEIPATKNAKEYTTFNMIKSTDSNIEIEYVKNSYKELNEINDKLIEYFSSEGADVSNLGAHYVDAFNNVVVVELINNNTTQTNGLKKAVFGGNTYKAKALDSDLIVFKNGEQQHNHATTLKAGQKISVSGGSCSMGFRVKIDGKAGYITAGHCFSGTGQSSTGGTVRKYKESGKVDAAFVETTSSYSPSNSLYYTSGSLTTLNNTLCPYLTVNKAIAKVGYASGYTSGKIKNLNYSGTYDGIYFTGLIATDYYTTGGDSGGAVFVPENVSSNAGGGVPLAGINKGTSSYGGAFVNADEIYMSFKYSRY